jgi:hypothetical protein
MQEPNWDEIWEDRTVSFTDELCRYFEVDPANPKVGMLFSLAWEHGHAGGLSDVVNWFEELAELIR